MHCVTIHQYLFLYLYQYLHVCIDIPDTVANHSGIIGNILIAHALSDCDATSALGSRSLHSTLLHSVLSKHYAEAFDRKSNNTKSVNCGKPVECLGNIHVHERDIFYCSIQLSLQLATVTVMTIIQLYGLKYGQTGWLTINSTLL